MRKIKSMIASIVLAGLTLCTAACQPQEPVDEKLSQAPDYSGYTHTFDPYAYSGPSDGYYRVDREPFNIGQDFRTVERYEEYKAAGFTVYMPQNTGVKIESDFNEEKWAQEKVYMDRAHEAGLKIILNDQRIQYYSKWEGSLFKENDEDTSYAFENEAALDAFIEKSIALYKDHPGFYGLMLGDEPRIYHVTSYGELYQALKRVLPDKFIQYNLLPIATDYKDDKGMDSSDSTKQGRDRFPELTDDEIDPNWTELDKAFAKYEKYLNMYMDAMPGVEYLQFDDYPIHDGTVDADYLRGLQIAAKICQERDLELHVVAQTFGMYTNGPDSFLNWTKPSKANLHWQNNVLLGMGVKQIHYFTYWTKADQSTTGEYFVDGASFVTYGGEKTDLYYDMQEIMAQNQAFAPVIKQFNYQGSKTYVKLPTNFDKTHILYADNSYTFKKLTSVEFEKEVGFVSELYDSENDNYLYMIMNFVTGWNEGSRAYQTNVVTFSDEYTHVVVYKNGVGTPQKLEEGNKLTVEVAPGEAVFVLPY